MRLSALFERTLDIPRAQRAAFIEDACADDGTLSEDLVSLLEAHDAAGDYFDDLSEHVVAAALTAIALPSSHTSASETLEAFQAKLGDAYRLVRELGGGGMSRVFVAEHLKLKRRVVIKVLTRETLPTANAERFQREIELAAQLQHPHIVPVLAAESADGTLYYTMPFVTGETLRDRLARERCRAGQRSAR